MCTLYSTHLESHVQFVLYVGYRNLAVDKSARCAVALALTLALRIFKNPMIWRLDSKYTWVGWRSGSGFA